MGRRRHLLTSVLASPGRPSRLSLFVRHHIDWFAAAWLFAIAVFYLWRLGAAPLMNPHEAQYAQIPREMMLQGEWITPYLNGARYLDKPPLAYWLGILIYQVGGVSEASARLISAIPMLVQACAVYLLGKRAFGRHAGLASLMVVSTMVSSYLYARTLMSDSLFACCLTVALACFHRALTDARAPLWPWVAGSVAVALAVMTKSLAGLVLPAAALVLLQLWTRSFVSRHVVVICVAVLLAGVLPWHVVVALRHPGFLLSYVGNEQMMRFFDRRWPKDYYTVSCWFYLVIVLAFSFPWVFFVPAALAHAWRCRWIPSSAVSCRLFLCWGVVMIGFFAASPAREPVYALPCYAALALLLGKLFVDISAGRRKTIGHRLLELGIRALIGALAVFAVAMPIVIQRLQGFADLLSLQAPAIGSACAAIVLATVALHLVRRQRVLSAVAIVALLAVPMLGLVGTGVAIVADVRSSRTIGSMLAERARPSDVVAMQSPDDHEYENAGGLAFYLGRRVRIVRRVDTPGVFWPPPPDQDFFLGEEDLAQAWASSQRVFLIGKADFIASLRLAPVCRLMEHGGQWLVSNRNGGTGSEVDGSHADCEGKPG